MMKPAALLFDFDGLICDTEHAAYRSWEILYSRYGLEFSKATWSMMVGSPTGECIALDELAAMLGHPICAADIELRRSLKFYLAGREQLRPGIKDLLGHAVHLQVHCAVVSSSAREWVVGHLRRLDVIDRFSVLVTGEQVEKKKPAPDLYLKALELLEFLPDRCIALEDSPIGIAAAKAAGLTCIGIPGMHCAKSDLWQADHVLSNAHQLAAWALY